MTQVLVSKHNQTQYQEEILVGTEAKNPVPISKRLTWEEIRGLSWVFSEDD